MPHTSFTYPFDIPEAKVVGPYSAWPRRKSRKATAAAKIIAVAAAGGVVMHCAPYYLT